jgi:hypothetical protein
VNTSKAQNTKSHDGRDDFRRLVGKVEQGKSEGQLGASVEVGL